MPIIWVSDTEKLKLLKVLDSRKPLSLHSEHEMFVRIRFFLKIQLIREQLNLVDYQTKTRFAIIDFQNSRKNNLLKNCVWLDSCSIKNLNLHLNYEVYPYEDFRTDFTNSLTAILYKAKAYSDIQKAYYGKNECEPLLSKKKKHLKNLLRLQLQTYYALE